MPIDNARNDDRRGSDAVGDLLQQRRGAADSGGSDGGAGVAVGEARNKEIHGGVDALQEKEGFGVVFRLLELGDEAEEGDVAGVGENDVGDGEEALGERWLGGEGDLAGASVLDANADHGDGDGAEDGDEGHDRHVGDGAELAGEGEQEADEGADDPVDDGAGRVGGEGVHHDGEGEDVGAHNEDEEGDLWRVVSGRAVWTGVEHTWAKPKISRPTGPSMTSPASAMLCTCGYRSLNCPITKPV